MKIGNVLIGGLCALTASLVSVHFFLDDAPEFHKVISADGLFSVRGSVYADQVFSLEEIDSEPALLPFGEHRYRLLPEDTRFADPLTVSFFLDSSHEALYRWDATTGYWEVLQGVQKNEDGFAEVPVREGGVYALGSSFSVETPTFIDVMSDLRSRLPEHAVSYALRLVATPLNGAPVLLPAFAERGGCGGIPTVSEQALTAQDERTVQVLVNDVLTSTVFTFLMDIGVTQEGCAEDMPMQVIL